MLPIKKEFSSLMCLNNRGGGAFRDVGGGGGVRGGGGGGGGGGAHQRVFYTRVFPLPLTDGYAMLKNPNKGETAVHGCHYTNLTAAWLAQLGERRSAECVFR